MAKIVLTISADNKATQSVKLLNAEVQTLSKTLSSIKVNKNLTTQINALSKYYTNLAKAAVRVNEATTKRQIAEQKLANEVKRGRTEDQRTLKVKAQRELQELRLKEKQDKVTQSTQKQTEATKQGTKANEEHRQSILSMTRGIFEWQIATTLVMKPLRMLRSMLQSINETLVKTEDAVIALQRVLPSGSASDSEISSTLYKIAQNYGQTFENVQQIATNFARTGMSWSDTIKATEAAVLALNVAELDAEEATTGLIAILSQFGLEASDLESVIDKLNKTADNFPVTTEKILAALQRTGSAASNAKLSLEETISLITALSKATGRSGENIGTALNSLIQYSRKDSALNTFAGLSDESAAVVDRFRKGAATILEVWQQVSKEIQSLDSRQADLLDSYFNTADGAALSDALDGELEDIYTEMAGVYDTANTFRKNYFIALLGNMDTVLQAQNTLADAEGYSQAENLKYMNTYTAAVNTLKAQWEGLVSDESGWGEFKKGLAGTGIAMLSLVEDVGGLQNALIYLASSIVFVSSTFKLLTGGINPVAKVILSLSKNIQNVILRIKELGGAGKNIKAAFTSWSKAVKDVSAYLKANAAAQKAAKTAQDALNASIKINASTTATAEAKQEAANIATQAKVAADAAATASTEALSVAMGTLSAIVNIVMIAITAAVIVITSIVQAVNKSKQATEEANEKLRENSKVLNENVTALNEQNEALFDNVQALEIYIKRIKDVTASEEERQEALSEIISISSELLEGYGLENDYLLTLTTSYAGLNEELEKYLGLAKEVAAEQAAQAYEEAQKASREAEKAVRATTATIDLAGPVTNEAVRRGLIESGVTTGMSKDHGRTKGVGVYGAVALDFEATQENLDTLKEWYDLIDKRLQNNSISNHSRWEATLAAGAVSDAIEKIENALNLQNDAIKNELSAWARNELLNTGLADDFYGAQGKENENYEALNRLLDAIRDNAEYTEEQRKALNALVSKELADYLGKYKAIVEENGKLTNDISKVTAAYDDLIKKLEELRDLNKEAYDWEEKKLAVLEAEQALENARNEATVRRFNQSTGQWEWRTDEKAIKQAEENLEKARLELEKRAYNNIIEQLEKGDATNESILAILQDVAPLLGADSEFVDAVINAFKEKTGVDITQPAVEQTSDNPGNKSIGGGASNRHENQNSTTSHMFSHAAYDSGGIANGLGYMPKATSEPETVNNPELTAKILSPVSNAQFDKYVRDMGIMFEMARQYSHAPIIERVGGGTDNRVDNSGQITMNGVTIGSDRRGNSLDELLTLANIIPKV